MNPTPLSVFDLSVATLRIASWVAAAGPNCTEAREASALARGVLHLVDCAKDSAGNEEELDFILTVAHDMATRSALLLEGVLSRKEVQGACA